MQNTQDIMPVLVIYEQLKDLDKMKEKTWRNYLLVSVIFMFMLAVCVTLTQTH